MDTLVGITLSEINQTEKSKYCMVALISGILKIQQTTDYNKKEANSQIQRTNCGYQWRDAEGNIQRWGNGKYELLGI